MVDAKESGKFKIDASELQAKYAALETEIRFFVNCGRRLPVNLESKCNCRFVSYAAPVRVPYAHVDDFSRPKVGCSKGFRSRDVHYWHKAGSRGR